MLELQASRISGCFALAMRVALCSCPDLFAKQPRLSYGQEDDEQIRREIGRRVADVDYAIKALRQVFRT